MQMYSGFLKITLFRILNTDMSYVKQISISLFRMCSKPNFWLVKLSQPMHIHNNLTLVNSIEALFSIYNKFLL